MVADQNGNPLSGGTGQVLSVEGANSGALADERNDPHSFGS
jgi:hypothetical protein